MAVNPRLRQVLTDITDDRPHQIRSSNVDIASLDLAGVVSVLADGPFRDNMDCG
jgi:hypothetical protein